MEPRGITEQVIGLVRRTGAYVRAKRRDLSGVQISLKSGIRDFVTDVDRESERMLVNGLGNILPDAGFLTEEETTLQKNADIRWVVDPLDGTINYMHDIPVYAISVALMQGETILCGVVYEIVREEMFYTWQGGASYCNGKEIRVSVTNELHNALIATGFPYDRTHARAITDSVYYFLSRCRDIRRLGSAATDLCYVACGRFDGYYEGSLHLWDIAAGILLVENAGGQVLDLSGGKDFASGRVAAANPVLIGKILEGIRF